MHLLLPRSFIRAWMRGTIPTLRSVREGFNLMRRKRNFPASSRSGDTRRRDNAAHLFAGEDDDDDDDDDAARVVLVTEPLRYSCIPSRHNLLRSAHTYVSHQHAYNIRVINVWLSAHRFVALPRAFPPPRRSSFARPFVACATYTLYLSHTLVETRGTSLDCPSSASCLSSPFVSRRQRARFR